MSDVIVKTAHDVCGRWLETVYSELLRCGSQPIEAFYVAAGLIAWDSCCGLLVVGPERVYRSAAFPIEGTTDQVCEDAFIVVDIVVLLLRCVPTLDDRGKAPAPEALNNAHLEILNDAAIIWNTVTGPLPEGWQRANVDQGFVGAQGGCVGVETRLSVGLAQDAWCPECVEVP